MIEKLCYVYYTKEHTPDFQYIYSDKPTTTAILAFLSTYKENVKMQVFKVTEEMFTEKFNHSIKEIISPSSKTIDLYIDLDDTIFDFKGAVKKIRLEKGINFPQAEYGFFANLTPLPDAVRVVKKLLLDPRYNVRFATAPSVYNPMSYTEKRVSIEKHFGFDHVDKMIIISEKFLLDRSRQGIRSILIDDLSHGYGQESFSEQLVFGSEENPNWEAIEEKLINNNI